MDKIRILQVHNFYDRKGGEEVVLKKEAELLRSVGHEVLLFSVENDNSTGIFSKIYYALSFFTSFSSLLALRREIKKFKPDVVHFHNVFPKLGVMLYALPSMMNVSSVLTVHNFRYTCANGLFLRDGSVCTKCLDDHSFGLLNSLFFKCYRGSFLFTLPIFLGLMEIKIFNLLNRLDKIIVMNEFNKSIIADYGVREDNIIVKPHSFVLPDTFSGKSKKYDFCFVGRLSKEKGLQVFFEAVSKSNNPNCSILVIGAGQEEFELRQSALELNLSVDFIGHVEHVNVIEFISSSRFLVFPSVWYETFGLVMIEAFSLGVPVIANNLGGNYSMVGSENGFLYNDQSSFIASLNNALSMNSSEYSRMSDDCRSAYVKFYTDDVNLSTLEKCYRDANEG